MLGVGLEDGRDDAPSTATHGPIPVELMLESHFVSGPLLLGAVQRARCPRRDQEAYSRASAMFAPISSTNTGRFAATLPVNIISQAALKSSSRSITPVLHFWPKPRCLSNRRKVGLLRSFP